MYIERRIRLSMLYLSYNLFIRAPLQAPGFPRAAGGVFEHPPLTRRSWGLLRVTQKAAFESSSNTKKLL